MTTYTYPDGRAYQPRRMTWGSRPLVRRASSVMSGASHVLQRPGGRWTVTMEFPMQRVKERSEIAGLIFGLAGGAHRLSLWDLSRPAPLGTINTSGVTCAAVAQFAESIVLNGVTGTLLAGDKFGVGGQVFMAVQTATASGGAMTVPVRHMARAAITAGSAVTLIKPATTFVPVSPEWANPSDPGGWCGEVAVELEEVW